MKKCTEKTNKIIKHIKRDMKENHTSPALCVIDYKAECWETGGCHMVTRQTSFSIVDYKPIRKQVTDHLPINDAGTHHADIIKATLYS